MEKGKKQLRYIIYRRKSSESAEKQTLSLKAQKRELDKFVKANNLKIVADFEESASAYKLGREKFSTMVKMIEDGMADAILVFHISRLARNMTDGGRIIDMLKDGVLQEIKTPHESYIKNSGQEFFLALQFAMSKKSSDDTSEFVKRDITTKLNKGEYPGFASLGYLNMDATGRISGKQYTFEKQALLEEKRKKYGSLKRVEQDPIVAPLIRRLFKLYATGQCSMNELRRLGDEWGLFGERSKRKLSKQTIRRVLTNPFYYGAILFVGKIYEPETLPKETRHDPIISKELFAKAQDVMLEKSRPVRTEEFYPYSSFMICGYCGKKISGTTAKGHHYYRCIHCKKNQYIREEELEKQAVEQISKMTLDDDFLQLALTEISRENEKEVLERNAVIRHQEIALKRTEGELETLMARYLSPGNQDGSIISEDELRERKKDILIKQEKLKTEIEDGHQGKMFWYEQAIDYVKFVHMLKDKFVKASPEKKREVFQYVFHKPTLTNKIFLTLEKNPHNCIIRFNMANKSTPTPFLSLLKTKTEVLTSASFTMRE